MPLRTDYNIPKDFDFMRDCCGVGDSIETTFSDGRKVVMSLPTPESAAYANELILQGRWKKVQPIKSK